jgi:hypothetical protein
MPETQTSVFHDRIGPLKLWQWMIALIVIGFALRVPVALTFSMWVDDGHTLKTLPLTTSELISERVNKGHFPWFFIVYQWWTNLTGHSIFALRLPSLIATLCAIPIAAAIGSRMAGAKGALIAGILITVHATMLRHAAELRMYSWMMLVGAGMMLAMLRLAERATIKRAMVLGVLHLVYLQLHASSVFYTIPLFMTAAVLGWRRKLPGEFLTGVLAAFLIPIIITIPCLVYLGLKHDKGESSKFVRTVPLDDFLQVIFQLGFGVDRKVKMWRLFCAFFVPLSAVWLIAKARYGAQSEAHSEGSIPRLYSADIAVLIFMGAFAGPTIAWLATVAGAPLFGATRYYLGGVVPLIAMLGAGVACLRRPLNGRAWVVTLVIVVSGIIAGREGTEQSLRLYNGGIKIPRMIEDIKSIAPPGSTLLVTHDVGVPEVVNYYLGDDHKLKVYSFSRGMDEDQLREFLKDKIHPDEDLYIFVYKGIKDQCLPMIETEFGPWADQIKSNRGQPTWYHFVRGTPPPASGQ